MKTSDLIQVVIAVILVGTLGVTAYQIKLLKMQLDYQYKWSKRDKTLQYSLSKNRTLQETRKELDEIFGDIHRTHRTIDRAEMEEKLKENDRLYTVISSLLAHWENLALAIHCHVADEEVAYEMTAGIVVSYFKAFEYFIQIRQEKNPRAYYYLINLKKRWEQRLSQGRGAVFSPFGKRNK